MTKWHDREAEHDERAFAPVETIERLRDAVAKEGAKPPNQRRLDVIRRWRRELEGYGVAQHFYSEGELPIFPKNIRILP